MTVSVRPWDQIAADLRGAIGAGIYRELTLEAAVAGDALAAEVARLRSNPRLGQRCGDMECVCESCTTEGCPCADRLSALTAVVAAVHTALDQWQGDRSQVGANLCVSAIAKAVGR